ncbi:FG-GAP repeat domain-containing protein [Nannocystis pusilla]|nr:VCBS repeat-containing protein [Nannocystis pusilla]
MTLGVFGVVACGPSPPPENDTEGGSSSTTNTSNGSMTGLPMTSPLPGTDPTITTADPPTTGAVTSEVDPSATTGNETNTVTTSPTSATSTTGGECGGGAECPFGQGCVAGQCVSVEVIPPCPVVAVVDSHFPLVHEPTSLVLADLDGDNDLDVATGAPELSLIEVQTQVSEGEFVPGETIALVPATGFIHLAAGDLDGDGDVDLAAALGSDVDVLLNHDGVWKLESVLDSQSGLRRVHLANADSAGPGLFDLITVGASSPNIGVWLGVGAGAFEPEPPFDAPLSFGIGVVDVNGDLLHDLVGPDFNDSFASVGVLIRDGGGGFVDGGLLPATGESLVQVLAGDLADDPEDIVELLALTRDAVGGLVILWSGKEHGAWDPVPRLMRPSFPLSGGLLADVDPDGDVDLVAATETNALVVLHGDGSGGFACERVFELGSPTTAELLAVGDVDLQGVREIVTADVSLRDLVVIKTL